VVGTTAFTTAVVETLEAAIPAGTGVGAS
jgi:hypothetical protein